MSVSLVSDRQFYLVGLRWARKGAMTNPRVWFTAQYDFGSLSYFYDGVKLRCNGIQKTIRPYVP